MITRKCPHPCSTEYSFSEEDLKWSSLNTYCPKCKSSLEVQHYQQDFNKRHNSLEKIGDGLYVDKDGWYRAKPNGELTSSGVYG